ncbi:MAG: energy transducer TonB [Verrucomicrobiota bacterium]|nr:energy transducer TonB [Verrucomicrobiota bacterium]
MSQKHIMSEWSRYAACGACAALLLLFGASAVHAGQWAAKPAPVLPRSVLAQGTSGSVVLGLVFENNGQVRDARVVRSSGVSGLDELAVQGAMHWRLNPAAMRPSDTTTGREHMIKFFQNSQVSRRVEPFTAFWKEL